MGEQEIESFSQRQSIIVNACSKPADVCRYVSWVILRTESLKIFTAIFALVFPLLSSVFLLVLLCTNPNFLSIGSGVEHQVQSYNLLAKDESVTDHYNFTPIICVLFKSFIVRKWWTPLTFSWQEEMFSSYSCHTLEYKYRESHTKAFSWTRVVMLAFIKKNLLLIMIHSAPSLI